MYCAVCVASQFLLTVCILCSRCHVAWVSPYCALPSSAFEGQDHLPASLLQSANKTWHVKRRTLTVTEHGTLIVFSTTGFILFSCHRMTTVQNVIKFLEAIKNCRNWKSLELFTTTTAWQALQPELSCPSNLCKVCTEFAIARFEYYNHMIYVAVQSRYVRFYTQSITVWFHYCDQSMNARRSHAPPVLPTNVSSHNLPQQQRWVLTTHVLLSAKEGMLLFLATSVLLPKATAGSLETVKQSNSAFVPTPLR